MAMTREALQRLVRLHLLQTHSMAEKIGRCINRRWGSFEGMIQAAQRDDALALEICGRLQRAGPKGAR